MSGECDECGEHTTECLCSKIESGSLQKWEDILSSEADQVIKSLEPFLLQLRKEREKAGK